MNRVKKTVIRIFAILVVLGMLLSLTACSQQNTEEVTKSITEFLTACGNSDYGIATQYLADEVINSKEDISKDESGLVWVRLPQLVKEKMSDNATADVEIRKYIGYGLKLMYGNAEVVDMEVENDTATVILQGEGQLLHWDSIDTIYNKISSATETEFINDYQWYKEKINDKGQKVVFTDIRNKVTPKVFKELSQGLEKQETIKYIKQVFMKKAKDGEWKITKVITSKDNGTNSNWFGDDKK